MTQDKEITIQDVISRKKAVTKRVDTRLILRAFYFAEKQHKDQKRRSGEPYIIHPLNVAYILADVGLDDATICAALLHDVVEDTEITHEDLVKEFGNEIAEMVAGVTKLSTIPFDSIEEQQAEEVIAPLAAEESTSESQAEQIDEATEEVTEAPEEIVVNDLLMPVQYRFRTHEYLV